LPCRLQLCLLLVHNSGILLSYNTMYYYFIMMVYY